MNALPIKTGRSPCEVIDELIADHGFGHVFLTITARLIKRTRPPDTKPVPRLANQRGVDGLSDHVRQDIGLPPSERPTPLYLIAAFGKRDVF